MKRTRHIWSGCLLLGLTLLPVVELPGRSQPPGHYRLMSDRGVYVAGEVVRFRVFNLNPPLIKEQGWSTVYYLELISPEGTSMNRSKWPLDGQGASGILNIPKDLPSGTYYLKGYTQWMKNEGPPAFQYLSLEIINPYRRELLRVDTTSPSMIKLQVGESCSPAGGPVMTAPDRSYSSRERISLDLRRPAGSTLLDCCISVARQGTLGEQWEHMVVRGVSPEEGTSFLPETRGVTLSGSVRQDHSGEPAPFAIVYLSSLGGGNEFYATYSDQEGKFYFALTAGEGEKEYFISSSLRGRTDLSLLVDRDFSAETVTLPSFPLQTVRTDPDLVSDLTLNAQIREQYRTAIPAQKRDTAARHSWFYGHSNVTVQFEDYIQLPDLEEYFTELITQVSLRRNGEIKSFHVRGEHPDLQYYPPLVMVDGVAVFDVESLLEISPRVVQRVEIVTAPYIRGNVTFGGIIHLITRNGNMGYMDLPASGLLLSYQKFAKESDQVHPGEPSVPTTPDVRNTLYWESSQILLPGETATISFLAPDAGGIYEIRILGYGPNGNCYEERCTFMVE